MINGVFIMTSYSFFIFTLALLTSIQPNDEQNYTLPRLLTILALFAFFYGAMYLTSQMYLGWQGKYDEDEGTINKYVTAFLAYHMLIAVLIVGMYGVSYALEVVGGVQFAYVGLLLIVRPYYLKTQNVLLIVCQTIGLAFTTFLILIQYVSLSDTYISYAVLAFEGLLLLVGILSIVRMCHHSSNNDRAFKLLHDEEDRLKGKDMFSKNEFKKHQEELLANHDKRPNFREKKVMSKQREKD
jgi:hypothetical protein